MIKLVKDARECSTSEARVFHGLSCFLVGGSLYVGYFDEFGHNGHYISKSDASYKTHPVFGLGGYIIPADNIRQFSAAFRAIKESGLKAEIDAKVISQNKRVDHWEKKRSALLTTRNISNYVETKRLVFRVLNVLEKLGGQVVFYGQEKLRGGPEQVHETNGARYNHVMKQLITRVHGSLPEGENLLMVLDKQGEKERLEIFVETAAFMFTSENGSRLIEPPMEVESHLYQTVQAADWICALLGRISAFKYDPDFSEFSWAIKYFGERLGKVSSPSSKIRGAYPGSKDVYWNHLSNSSACFDSSLYKE